MTNLLPNDSQVVYSIHVNKFMGSTLGGAAFHSASGFKLATFNDRLGLPLDKMSRFVRAESLKSGWVFNVIQMSQSFSITSDAMKAKLGSRKGPKNPIKGHDYYLLSPNEELNGVSAIDFRSILNPRALAPRSMEGQLAWHLYNSQTLIIAEVNQLEQFLQSGREPPMLSKLTDEAAAAFSRGQRNQTYRCTTVGFNWRGGNGSGRVDSPGSAPGTRRCGTQSTAR